MKFLFVLQYPGYLRYFDSVMKMLVERGHTVAVAYDIPHKQPEGAEALDGVAVENLGMTPRRSSVWGPVGRGVRGTIDYIRYLDPRFADAPHLRDRMRQTLPPVTRFLARFNTISSRATSRLLDILYACERTIPPSTTLAMFFRRVSPDAVIVSPLVTDQCPQVDIIKTAQSMGLPNALCVASWDHLTTKGLMRIQPDLVTVWNPHQRDEALAYHRAQADRIVVTGANPFDRWFGRIPRRSREEFCREVGLPADRPIVLFVGSTQSISKPVEEEKWVREWARRLRAELDIRGIKVGILIRPHPYNSAHWLEADLSDVEYAAVYPRHAANPVNEDDRADYFDSMYHSAAVVGINTTAMIESAIVGRTVHTILDQTFSGTQEGTLHFRYLLPTNGGFLRVASSLDEHVMQLADTLRDPSADRAALEAFVSAFVRPNGLTTPATPLVVQSLEELAERRAEPVDLRIPWSLYPVKAMLWLMGCVAVYRDPRRLRRRLALTGSRRRKERLKRAEKEARKLLKQRAKLEARREK
jgi:hypothetical protein